MRADAGLSLIFAVFSTPIRVPVLRPLTHSTQVATHSASDRADTILNTQRHIPRHHTAPLTPPPARGGLGWGSAVPQSMPPPPRPQTPPRRRTSPRARSGIG